MQKLSMQKRFLSLLLALVMVFGLMPINLFTAEAKVIKSSATIGGLLGLSDDKKQFTIKAYKEGAGTTIKTTGANNAYTKDLMSWWNSYSGTAADGSALNGVALCSDHTKTSTTAGYRVILTDQGVTNDWTRGVVATGYPTKDKASLTAITGGYINTLIQMYATNHPDGSAGNLTGAEWESYDMASISEDDFIKASQIAIWHSLGNITLDGAPTYAGRPNASGETIYADKNTGADARRLLAVAKYILLNGDIWTKPNIVEGGMWFGGDSEDAAYALRHVGSGTSVLASGGTRGHEDNRLTIAGLPVTYER